jgi:hypothetical protein
MTIEFMIFTYAAQPLPSEFRRMCLRTHNALSFSFSFGTG